ncbi:glutathione S-transferase family protein [Phreatobacter stygius]|uniref:glutathione transferase n=1 Tax=Phreatobacter stygius TaxID=1940610 RepID=A0A4D7BAV6_9HYPH|nr:glutathione S-transferase [Phreatobacter stygius]QCI66606.1 glutathione S-transferase [Phreatobacter stygius]
MIKVHHLNNSRSQRILWLLEELGLDYAVIRYERDPATRKAPAALKAIHPLGKSPVIDDGEIVLAESAAIVEYLVGRYGKDDWAPPRDAATYPRYLYWMHFAEGSAMTPILLRLYLKPVGEPAAPMLAGVEAEIRKLLDFVEAELGDKPFFLGDHLTAADIQMSFPLEAMRLRGDQAAAYPKITAFLARIHARPGYQRALERGGRYDLIR